MDERWYPEPMGMVFGGMAASLDGFIASRDGDLSWLNDAMSPEEDYGFAETARRTGAYIVGASTYREIVRMGTSSGDRTPTFVVTHQNDLERLGDHVTLYSGDPRELVKRVKAQTDRDICLFGGANLLTQFLDLDLIDELGMSIIPVLLGDGVPFFGRLAERKRLKLVECKPFKSGIVLLNYTLSP
jgi:dihydrofolate reductase